MKLKATLTASLMKATLQTQKRERRGGVHNNKREEELIYFRKNIRRGDRKGFKNPISEDGVSLLMKGR